MNLQPHELINSQLHKPMSLQLHKLMNVQLRELKNSFIHKLMNSQARELKRSVSFVDNVNIAQLSYSKRHICPIDEVKRE